MSGVLHTDDWVTVKNPDTQEVTRVKTLNKRYYLILTCFVTRLVHLELIYNRTSDEVIRALKRAFHRRGHPSYIFTDGEAAFRRADKELNLLWQEAKPRRLEQGFSTMDIEFKYRTPTPAGASSAGMYERLNRNIKSILDVKLGRCRVSTRELEDILIECESMINNRPLCRCSESINEVIVTPHDLYMNRQTAIYPAYKLGKGDAMTTLKTANDVKKRRKYISFVSTQIWRKFLTQYVDSLISQAPKDADGRRPPKIDDIVLLRDSTMADRGLYPLARVTRVFRSRDDALVRSVEVTLANGTKAVRPLALLSPLELDAPYL